MNEFFAKRVFTREMRSPDEFVCVGTVSRVHGGVRALTNCWRMIITRVEGAHTGMVHRTMT